MLLLVNSTSCRNQEYSDVWKKRVLSNNDSHKMATVLGAQRLTSDAISSYMPVQIGETILSEALIEADENVGSDFMRSEVTQPYFKGENNLLIKITDYIDVTKHQYIIPDSIEYETTISKTYSDNEGRSFTETIMYDDACIMQSRLEIRNKRFTIQITAQGIYTSPAPSASYLIFVFNNSYLPRLFELPLVPITKNSLYDVNH